MSYIIHLTVANLVFIDQSLNKNLNSFENVTVINTSQTTKFL